MKKRIVELNVSEPDGVGGYYLKKRFVHAKRELTLRRFNGEWMYWEDGRYAVLPNEVFRSLLRRWLVRKELKRYGRDGELIDAVCTIRVVDEIVDAVKAETSLFIKDLNFFWIDDSGSVCPDKDVISFNNGILDTTAMLLYEHTPNWFTTCVLPFDFNKKARCPNWEDWLKETCGEDSDWIRCLQLWFGYMLIADTSQQRFAHFFGPPRSGKGTATRILCALLGKGNTTSPTLTQMGKSETALWTMVDKLIAVIPDAVIGRSVDSKVVMEMLSSIIGEDPVNVKRKYLSDLDAVHMKIRFTVTSNEPLKWPDPTNKLSNRCLVFPFSNSYAGNEDPSIEVSLMKELPGIANWALKGLKRLKKGEKLKEPDQGKAKHRLFSDLDSPILLFCRTCLKEAKKIDKKTRKLPSTAVVDIHDLWFQWSQEEGRSTKNQTKMYVRSLVQGAFPHVKVKHRGKRGSQVASYVGLVITKSGKILLKRARRRTRARNSLKNSFGIT